MASGKCSYERLTRGTECGTMRSMCGADAGCSAINYQSLYPLLDDSPAPGNESELSRCRSVVQCEIRCSDGATGCRWRKCGARTCSNTAPSLRQRAACLCAGRVHARCPLSPPCPFPQAPLPAGRCVGRVKGGYVHLPDCKGPAAGLRQCDQGEAPPLPGKEPPLPAEGD